MVDKNQEQLSEKLQRSMLPGEVNRQKDLFRMLNDKKME